MVSITIRNLDETLKARLRVRAATHGHSMEEEARQILRSALSDSPPLKKGLGSEINALFKASGGIDLALPVREPLRDPPDFGS